MASRQSVQLPVRSTNPTRLKRLDCTALVPEPTQRCPLPWPFWTKGGIHFGRGARSSGLKAPGPRFSTGASCGFLEARGAGYGVLGAWKLTAPLFRSDQSWLKRSIITKAGPGVLRDLVTALRSSCELRQDLCGVWADSLGNAAWH